MNRLHPTKIGTLACAALLALLGISSLPAAPGVPRNLVVTDSGANSVTLTWDAPNTGDPADKYQIYRRGINATTSEIEHTWQHTTSNTTWTQHNLSQHESYEYRVVAYTQLPNNQLDVGPGTTAVVHALGRFPFILPWNGTTVGSITDRSAWNGSIQRIHVASDGTFRLGSASGTKIRFLGVNLSAAACFPDPDDAPLVAKRMAQFGINLVRLHQIDQPTPKGLFTDGTYSTLDDDQMTKLGFLVKALKDNGIYVDLNLRVLMRYPNPDNGGAYELLKGVDIYSTTGGSDSLRARQKSYATQLLNYSNSAIPGLGKYKDDPVVAMIEISNEDGLLAEWIDGEIDTLSSGFRNELGALWKDWLQRKYGNDETLSELWSGQPGHSHGEEILPAALSSPPAGSTPSDWKDQIISPAAATIQWVAGTADGVGSPSGNAAKINVTTANTAQKWHVQLLLNGREPAPDAPHTLRFHGKTATGSRDIRVIYRNGAGDVIHNIASLKLGPQWQEFTIALPATGAYTGKRTIAFTDFAAQTGVSYLSGFSLTTGNDLAGPLASATEYSSDAVINALVGTTDAYNFPASETFAANGPWSLNNNTSHEHVPDGRADGVPSLRINLENTGTAAKDVILRRILWSQLLFGSGYELTFDVKGSVAGTIVARGQMHADPYASWNESSCAVSTGWVTRKLRFHVTHDNNLTTPSTASRIDFDLGLMPHGSSVEFANISVRALPDNVLTASPAAFNFTGSTLPAGWEMNHKNGATSSVSYEPGGRTTTPQAIDSLKITAETAGATGTDAILRRLLYTQLAYGKTYTVTFDVKASTAFDLVARGQMHHNSGYTVFGSATHAVSTVWSSRSVSFTVSDDTDADPSIVPSRVDFDLGLLPAGANVEFANIAIREGGATGLANTETLSGDFSPPTLSDFHARTRQVQQDWIEFLWNTEVAYLQDMRSHIKALAPATPLIGTQGEYSPNLIQAEAGMDVIDAHGYWQHPSSFQYPWHYVNTPMSGVSDASIVATTLPRRIGRRIIGKPYLCSEYNHPAPNTYGTEAMPLIGAYAAMQGWAGVVAFDYENLRNTDGTIAWDSGREGWFSMGRAPAKMITMPAARAMLDRAHVANAYSGGIGGAAYVGVRKATAIEMIRRMLTPAISAVDFGVPDRLAYVMPVGMKYVTAANEPDHRAIPSASVASPYASAAGDLKWDTTAGLVSMKGSLSKAAIGNLPTSGVVDLGHGVTLASPGLQLQGASQNWSAFVLTRTDDQTESDFGALNTRWLLTTTGYSGNHLVRWRLNQGPTNATSSVISFGETPTLLERIDGTLTFKVPSGTLVVRPLDVHGVHNDQTVTVTYTGSGSNRTATVVLPQPARTPWYEMFVTP